MVISEAHLRTVLQEFVAYYNAEPPTDAWSLSHHWRRTETERQAPDGFTRGRCSAVCTMSTSEQPDYDGLLPPTPAGSTARISPGEIARPVKAHARSDAGRHARAQARRSAAGVAHQATDGVRLAEVHEGVGQRTVAEEESLGPALEVVPHPQRVLGDEAVALEHTAHVRGVVD